MVLALAVSFHARGPNERSSGKRREEMNAINNSRSRDEELSARAAGAEMKRRALPTVYTGRASGRGCKCRG